jgi:hypothetical protein
MVALLVVKFLLESVEISGLFLLVKVERTFMFYGNGLAASFYLLETGTFLI